MLLVDGYNVLMRLAQRDSADGPMPPDVLSFARDKLHDRLVQYSQLCSVKVGRILVFIGFRVYVFSV